MQLFVGILFLLSISVFAQTQATPVIADPASRTTISLDGTWNTIVDPYESGIPSRYFQPTQPKNKSQLMEFDFDHSPKLHVPGDWNTQRESLLLYEGPLWHQRQFSYAKKLHQRVFLYLGAANYLARVWLNGYKLGDHVGGFTPFNFEVTDQLVDGENSVVIEVDNTRRLDGVPSTHTDWWNYGGLTRSVKLIEVPKTFIENYSMQMANDTQHQMIQGWVQMRGAVAGLEATVAIPEAGVLFKAPIADNGLATINVDVRGLVCGQKPQSRCSAPLKLWSPDNPKLYQVEISAEGDQITD